MVSVETRPGMSMDQATIGSVGPQSGVPEMWSNTATRGSVGPLSAGQPDPVGSNFVVTARGTRSHSQSALHT